MGKIINGKYYPDDTKIDLPEVSGGWHEDSLQAQRDKYRKDILQPRQGGRLNMDFFRAYPEKADQYGLTPDERREFGL